MRGVFAGTIFYFWLALRTEKQKDISDYKGI